MTNSSDFDHAFGTSNEWSVVEMMVIFIVILLLTMLLQYTVSHRLQLSFLGEASVAMLTGLVCGGIVKAIKSDNEESKDLQENVLSFSPTVFFTVLLPPIIFSSGYQMKASWFFNNVWKVRNFSARDRARDRALDERTRSILFERTGK